MVPPQKSESAHMGGFTHEKGGVLVQPHYTIIVETFFPKTEQKQNIIHAWQMYALDMSSKFQ